MTWVDYVVIIMYFCVLLLLLGYVFKDKIKNTSDYFKGGGQMLWWMVGATAFMNQFSAWTFTGGTGAAFNNGFQMVILWSGGMMAFVLSYLYFAQRMKQMRITTIMEGVRRRFGPVNEQVFTWTGVPLQFISAGVWLSGLGIIVSSALGIPMEITLISTGSIVVIISLIGGAWAVVASDYIQMLIVVTISLVVLIVVMIKGGGPINIINNFPADSFIYGNDYKTSSSKFIFWAWVILTYFRAAIPNNSIHGSFRYHCAKDSKNAKKAPLIGVFGYLFGICCWVFPAWFAASQFPNLAEMYPNVKNVGEVAYLAVVQNFLPVGMTGLFITAIFAATMSSMDTCLNQNTGVMVRSFYNPILKKGKATDEEMLRLSKILTVVFGIIIILIALFINQLKDLTLFDITLKIQALIQMPVTIPLLFCVVIKNTPDWAGWGTFLMGTVVSIMSNPTAQKVIETFDLILTKREINDLNTVTATAMHMIFTVGFFFMTMLFYKKGKTLSLERQKQVDSLFDDLDTPVINTDKDQEQVDLYQRKTLGKIICGVGLGILLLTLSAKNLEEVAIVLLSATIMSGFGIGLLLSVKRNKTHNSIK